MKKRILSIALGLIFLTASFAMAASSAYQNLTCKGNACVLRVSWTTHTDGSFAAITTQEVNGFIDRIETDPSGTAAPSDNYDISIANYLTSTINGTSTTTTNNICGDTGTWTAGEITTGGNGILANRDTAVTESTRFLINGSYSGLMNIGPLLIDISNAGNSKSGVINIYYFKTN